MYTERQSMTESEPNIPPLPEFGDHGCIVFRGKVDKRYSEDQMRAYALDYARAAVLKERQEIAEICDRMKEQRFASGNVREGSAARTLAEIIRNRT